MHHRLMSNSSRLKFTTMKLLLQKIASLLQRHFCNRQPPLRQGEFQFRPRVPLTQFVPSIPVRRCQRIAEYLDDRRNFTHWN